MQHHKLKVWEHLYKILEQPEYNCILFAPCFLEDCVTDYHLVSSKGIFEDALQNVQHHIEGVLELGKHARLYLKNILDKLSYLSAVRLAIYGCDVEKLGYIK